LKINKLLAGTLAIVLIAGFSNPAFAENSAIGSGAPSGPLGTSEIISSSQASLKCDLVTFEGLGDGNPVGTIGDATFAGAAAFTDSDDGGSAAIANEPSPITVMAGPETQVVTLANPKSQVSFWYVITASEIIVRIFGAGDVLLDSFNTPVLTQGIIGGDPTGFFDNWNQVVHKEGSDVITKIEIEIVSPGGWVFDDFEFCTGQDMVGGEFLPIDSTALLLAGAQTNAVWILSALAVIGSVAFGALYITSKKN